MNPKPCRYASSIGLSLSMRKVGYVLSLRTLPGVTTESGHCVCREWDHFLEVLYFSSNHFPTILRVQSWRDASSHCQESTKIANFTVNTAVYLVRCQHVQREDETSSLLLKTYAVGLCCFVDGGVYATRIAAELYESVLDLPPLAICEPDGGVSTEQQPSSLFNLIESPTWRSRWFFYYHLSYAGYITEPFKKLRPYSYGRKRMGATSRWSPKRTLA